MLSIKNLKVNIGKKQILKGVNLVVSPGETHAIMGPNGSGKSTLAQSLFSHPTYSKTSGKILFNKKNITNLPPDKIARLGMLLAFQYPQTIPGVSVTNLLKIANHSNNKILRSSQDDRKVGKKKISLKEFLKSVEKQSRGMNLPQEFLTRSLNEGFSGGEKKKAEVLQISVLKPKLAVFDETDSGLDVDSLKIVGKKINELQQNGTAVLIITHYNRILKYVKPDFVHIMKDGRIVESGKKQLAERIEKRGYNKKFR